MKIRAEFLGGPWDGKIVVMDVEFPYKFVMPDKLPSIAREEIPDPMTPSITVMEIRPKMQSNGVWILDWNDRA